MAAVQEVEMRVNEKADELDQLEFEYESKIKISDLEVAKVENAGVQIAFVFGDMIEKVKYEEMLEKSFLMNATPEKMSEFLAENSLTVFFVSIADNRLLGEISLDLNACFLKAIKCGDFRSETLKKAFDISSGSKCVGKATIEFKVAIDWESSEIHREFYTHCTKISDERKKLAASDTVKETVESDVKNSTLSNEIKC